MDGHYRVFIDGQWIDVPDEAVVKEPNRAGRDFGHYAGISVSRSDASSSDHGVDDMHALTHFALAVVVAIVTILVVAFIFFMNAETDTTVSEIGKWRALW